MCSLLFKPAALYVFCDPTDAICICTETSHVATVSHVMYGNFSRYQFVWLCGWDTDGSTSIMEESNPGYGEYTIYGV